MFHAPRLSSPSYAQLAFPKGLGAAAGRPRVPPSSPVVFDVQLLYIPGISDDLASEEEAPVQKEEASVEA